MWWWCPWDWLFMSWLRCLRCLGGYAQLGWNKHAYLETHDDCWTGVVVVADDSRCVIDWELRHRVDDVAAGFFQVDLAVRVFFWEEVECTTRYQVRHICICELEFFRSLQRAPRNFVLSIDLQSLEIFYHPSYQMGSKRSTRSCLTAVALTSQPEE